MTPPPSDRPPDEQLPATLPPAAPAESPGPPGAAAHDDQYRDALASVRHAIERFGGCTDQEKQALVRELAELESMARKLEDGRVEIVLFGEIDTGKSALINALVGQNVAQVDVRGGWTREVWSTTWSGAGYVVPGFMQSEVVLVDTPGINEVDGQQRADMAHAAAARADLILFVTDSDLNHTEHQALATLAASHKPILLVFNKIDNYTREQRAQLRAALVDSRMRGLIGPEDVVEAAADPLPREYIVEQPDGTERHEYRRPPVQIEALKARILEMLDRDGKSLLALNAAMYAADRSDRIATLKVRMRDERANAVIWSYAAMKSIGVALTPVPAADVLGGSAVDVTMVVTLAHIYGISLTWVNARQLIESIVKAAGWVMLGEMVTHLAASLFKGLTLGAGVALTALPQGAAAGYGSFVVGQAAKYYFEHGASWGGEAPKTIVKRILEATDKQSVLERLKGEINAKIRLNPHAKK
ncbi:MAG: YcjF family protein [Pirellulales bacterium]